MGKHIWLPTRRIEFEPLYSHHKARERFLNMAGSCSGGQGSLINFIWWVQFSHPLPDIVAQGQSTWLSTKGSWVQFPSVSQII